VQPSRAEGVGVGRLSPVASLSSFGRDALSVDVGAKFGFLVGELTRSGTYVPYRYEIFVIDKSSQRKSVGRRLQEARQAVGLSQDEMANALGISSRGLRNYEDGSRELPSSVGFKLCKTYSIDPIWLYEGVGLSPRVKALGGEGAIWREAITLVEQYLRDESIELSISAKVKVVDALVEQMLDGQNASLKLVSSLVRIAA